MLTLILPCSLWKYMLEKKKNVLQKKTDCVNKGMSIRNAAGL